MIKKRENILLFFLFLFSIYSALNIGQSWDQDAELLKDDIDKDKLIEDLDNRIKILENKLSIENNNIKEID